VDASSSARNAQPLAGKHVVLTRPQGLDCDRGEADALMAQLMQWGARVSRIPLIEVCPVPWQLPADMAWDWLFFTSQNAAHAFYQAIDLPKNQLANLSIAVVGPATGEALVAYGQKATFTAPRYDAENAAEAFCDAYSCKGLRVLWPCGNLANSQLSDILSAAGAVVTPLVVYETTVRAQLPPVEAALLASGVDMVVLASPSAVSAYQQVVHSMAMSRDDVAIACLGPKTAEAARMQLGRVDVQPRMATIHALADAIKTYYQPEKKRDD
jgi:uroporphyrinogen-III synthase